MFGKSRGFTLIELMIVVVVVAILAAIALPSYSDYMVQSRIPDATSNLAAKRVQMEQWFQDKHVYSGAPIGGCTADTATSQYFDFGCPTTWTDTAYTLEATGKGRMTGFKYTIDQGNVKTTTIGSGAPSGWAGSSTSCWITKKGGAC